MPTALILHSVAFSRTVYFITGRFCKHVEHQDQTAERVSDRIVRNLSQASVFVEQEKSLLLQQAMQKLCLRRSHQQNERSRPERHQRNDPQENKHVPF